MKNLFTTFSFLFILLIISSCSKDEIDQNNDIVGVWERIDINKNSNSTYKLVFASDNSGLSVNSNIINSDEISSSIGEFKWEVIGDEITVIRNDVSKDIYLLNTDGQLVLNTVQNLPFIKISNNTQEY